MKKLYLFILLAFIIVLLISQCLTFGGTRRTFKIDPTPVDAYQVMIRLNRNTFNYNAARPDGSDIRVFDTEGNNLNHWIENWNPYGISTIWIRVPHAGTENIIIKSGNPPGETPGSDGRRVFDPVKWEDFKTNWLYSGIIPGMVSGWEYFLTEFDKEVSDWKLVDIDTDFVNECEHSRWFVRKEVFIAQGVVSFSGNADDDVVWSLIRSDELYRKIGGDEVDSDGENPGAFSGKIVMEEPFGHFIWAGRGQEGVDAEELKIVSIDSGIDLLYTRKSGRPEEAVPVTEKPEVEPMELPEDGEAVPVTEEPEDEGSDEQPSVEPTPEPGAEPNL